MNRLQPAPENARAPRAVSDRDLPALIRHSGEPVVVESHFAGWAEPWRALSGAAWRELLAAFDGEVAGALLETGQNRELAARYGLEIIPTVLVFLRGELVARFTGTVAPEAVIGAVRAARERARVRESESRELAAVAAANERSSPVRSILRRRAPEPALAHAG